MDNKVIYITQKVYNKMFQYVAATDNEISGLGIVEELPGIGIVITDIYLLKQINTPASTELDPMDVSKLLTELAKQGKETRLLLWWHSHANMDTFWSGTDNRTIEGLKSGSYFISMVVNKRFDIKARIEIFSPVSISLDNVPVKVLPDISEILQDIKDEVHLKVATPQPVFVNPFIQGKGNMFFPDREFYQDEQEFCDDVMLEVMSETQGRNLTEAQIQELYQKRLAEYGITLEDI